MSIKSKLEARNFLSSAFDTLVCVVVRVQELSIWGYLTGTFFSPQNLLSWSDHPIGLIRH